MKTTHETLSKLTKDQMELLILTIINLPPVSLDLLTMISSLSPVTALQTLQALVAQQILEVDREKGFGYYRLSPSQSAEQWVSSIDRETVSEMVEKTIQYVNEVHGDSPDGWVALAHLQIQSGSTIDPGLLLKAAQHLRKEHRADTADRYFERVIELLPASCDKDDDKKMYIETVHGLLSTRYKSMPMPEQKTMLDRARQYAKEIDAIEWDIRLSIHFARVCSFSGEHQKAAQLSDDAWNLTKKWDHPNQEPLQRWVALATAEFLAWEGRFSEALERYETTIGNLEAFSSDSATLRACAWLGYYYCQCGQFARGIGLMETVRVKAIDLNHKTAENWATLLLATMLAEMGRFKEGESLCNALVAKNKDSFGVLESWLHHYLQAYFRFRHGDLSGCFHHHNEASEMLQAMEWWHLPVPLLLEYLEALELAGMVPSKCNFETMINENLTFPDIFMQGVALRYRTQYRMKNHGDDSTLLQELLDDLNESLELLTRSGAKVQRAYTQIVIARLLMAHRQDVKRIRHYLEAAWALLSGIDESLFPKDLKDVVHPADREARLVESLIEVGNTLGTIREKGLLIRKIIQVTMNFSQVEKGAMFLLNPDRKTDEDEMGHLELAASRNMDASVIQSAAFQEPYRWIVEAATQGREFIEGRAIEGEDDILLAASKTGVPLKICCPVMLGKRTIGVLYLESGSYGATFSKKDIPFFRVLCNQIAVALDNLYAYEEISRLKERLLAETHLYQEALQKEVPTFGQIVGESRVMQSVFAKIRQVAKTDSTVLITGETGVGKELVARSIHQLSNRSDGTFIALNTAALDANLVGSELFGHEKGAFTHAISKRLGRFELADQGTIFLDDVDNLQLDIQAKLLRVIQEKEFERIGGKNTIRSDFRLIAATNQNLKILVSKDRFREDLYYRLNIFPIHVPPLRERVEDIPRLAHFFLKRNNKKLGKCIDGISNAQMKRLQDYRWPGNVRELKHVIERASIISTGKKLNLPELNEAAVGKESKNNDAEERRFQTLEEAERAHIINALERCSFKVSGAGGAAELLGLKTSTLNSKMKRLGISRKVNFKVDG